MNFNLISARSKIILFFCVLPLLNSCHERTNRLDELNTDPPKQAQQTIPLPDFNYIIEPLPGWRMFDTVIQGLNVRLILCPKSLVKDYPAGNITVGRITQANVDTLLESNMQYLKDNSSDVTIVNKGKIIIDNIDARWFTYTRVQNGIKRDMINYIIPVKELAYFMTFGVNEGRMATYRSGFDVMAKSFQLHSVKENAGKNAVIPQSTSKYVFTGFYFLAEEEQGIRMKKDKSEEVFWIASEPFASVANVLETRLQRTNQKSGTYTELYMKFDAKGTADLANGMGNPAHSKIAVVVANKLLYVVDNHQGKVSSGVMSVGLVGYSEEEMEAFRRAVEEKK